GDNPVLRVELQPKRMSTSSEKGAPPENLLTGVPYATVGTRAGQERDDNGLKMKFCWCPQEPERRTGEDQVAVTLTRGFWLGKYAVTQAEYKAIMGTNPSFFSTSGGYKAKVEDTDTSRWPVDNVSWFAAREFCRKLTDDERQTGRLPANWEYNLPTDAQRE